MRNKRRERLPTYRQKKIMSLIEPTSEVVRIGENTH